MSSQNYTQHTQTLRAKYLKTDQMDEEEKEVNDSQNELCQAHGLNVVHVQKVTEALRIPVRKTKDEVAHVLSEEKSELSEVAHVFYMDVHQSEDSESLSSSASLK